MSGTTELLNSFTAFASLSITLSVLTFIAIGMAFFSGFDHRAANIKVSVEASGTIGCRTFESWSDNSVRLRLVYRELYFLKALAMLALIPLLPVGWNFLNGLVAYTWLPALVIFAVSLQVYRNALDNRLKALQA